MSLLSGIVSLACSVLFAIFVSVAYLWISPHVSSGGVAAASFLMLLVAPYVCMHFALAAGKKNKVSMLKRWSIAILISIFSFALVSMIFAYIVFNAVGS